jgi:hypothetical protein
LKCLQSLVPLWDVALRFGAPKLTFEVTACSLARESGGRGWRVGRAVLGS